MLIERQQPSQKVVLPDEAEQLINNGWRFSEMMPNGKVVVEKLIKNEKIK